MFFTNRVKEVQSGQVLTWDVVRGSTLIPLSIQVRFVNKHGVEGVYLDPQGTNIPSDIQLSEGVNVLGSRTFWGGEDFGVVVDGKFFQLFDIRDVKEDGRSAELYFHAFPPKEFIDTMGGMGLVYDTPVMYQESFNLPSE